MEKELVSILTPCYNGEKFISRLLDSILLQDYDNIEFIVVDDGSVDSSKEVIESYKKKFSDRQYNLKYIYQPNKGQAAAINKALQNAQGDFFIWPDADDYFCSSQAISKMVAAFKRLDSTYGYVRCWAQMVDDRTFHQVCISKNRVDSENLFEAFLNGTESHAAAGTYLFRMKAFLDVNPSRRIFDKFRPQNCQLLLPMSYKYKCYTLKEPLHAIVLRSGSHSRREKDYSEQIATIDSYLTIHNQTLETMDLPIDLLQKYKLRCLNKLLIQKLDLALNYMKKDDASLFYKELNKNNVLLNKGKVLKVTLLKISPLFLRIALYLQRKFIRF